MYRSLAKLPVWAALALMGALSAHAAPGDVEFVLEHKIRGTEADRINYVSQGSGGETILCGIGGGGAWVSVLGRSGQPKFSAAVNVPKDGAHEACWTVLAHDASKTLIAGETNSHSLVGKDWGQESLPEPRRYETTPRAALLASVLSDGSTSDKRVLGNFKKYYRNGFYRSLQVSDGYV